MFPDMKVLVVKFFNKVSVLHFFFFFVELLSFRFAFLAPQTCSDTMKEARVRVRDVRGFSTFVLLFQQPNGGWISLRTRVSITRRGILRIYSGVLLGDVTLV